MPQSLSKILIHIIFSTKNRNKSICEEIKDELYAYTASICAVYKCHLIAIGGTSDHVHILCCLARNITVSILLEKIKTSTSKWIKTKNDVFKTFYWQNGYGVFSVSQQESAYVTNYIDNQKKHHDDQSFKEEYIKLLHENDLAYDEKYIWD